MQAKLTLKYKLIYTRRFVIILKCVTLHWYDFSSASGIKMIQ